MKLTKKLSFIGLLMVIFFFSCNDEAAEDVQNAFIRRIEGIETQYQIQLNDTLRITPKVQFTEGDTTTVSYEWSINNEIVSREPNLKVPCKKLGSFYGYLKVSTNSNAEIKEFQLLVSSSYDHGLLLLTEHNGTSMLTYKRLDALEVPATRDVFAINNPKLSLGATPLSLCWTGEGITNPNNINDFSNGLEVIVSSSNPTKVFVLDANTLKVKTEVSYKGEGTFHPNYIFVPYGGQNMLWDKGGEVVCFLGNGREYIMTLNREFSLGRIKHQLPTGVQLADMACSLITNPTDMLKVYFDKTSKHLIYVSGISELKIGTTTCNIQPMLLTACGGQYADENADLRYEPREVLLIGSTNTSTTLYRFSPASKRSEETLIAKTNVTGHILPTSAVGVNPIKPFVYYSDEKGNIYSYNYESNNFSTEPYISLGHHYRAKQLIFNPYNPNELYVAAEDISIKNGLVSSLFIYDVNPKDKGKLIRKDEHIGGKTIRLIYKGNGRENRENTKL